MRRVVEQEGFEQSKSSLTLRRHALERRDHGVAFIEDFACKVASQNGLEV
jgi:hypothetical protein